MDPQAQPSPSSKPAPTVPPLQASSSAPAALAASQNDTIAASFADLVARKKKGGLAAAQAVDVAIKQLRRDASNGVLDGDNVEKWIVGSANQIERARRGL